VTDLWGGHRVRHWLGSWIRAGLDVPSLVVGRGRVISLLALGVGALVCLYVPGAAEATRASSEDIGGRTIHTAVRVMAADGARVAVITRSVRGDCEHVAVWTPAVKSVLRFPARREPCTGADTIGSVALAGTQAAWLWATTTGTYVETGVITATLVHPKAVMPVLEHNGAQREGAGEFTRRPVGHAGLLAFTVEHACDADAVRNQGPGGRAGPVPSGPRHRGNRRRDAVSDGWARPVPR
jgi:hypothetical protein